MFIKSVSQLGFFSRWLMPLSACALLAVASAKTLLLSSAQQEDTPDTAKAGKRRHGYLTVHSVAEHNKVTHDNAGGPDRESDKTRETLDAKIVIDVGDEALRLFDPNDGFTRLTAAYSENPQNFYYSEGVIEQRQVSIGGMSGDGFDGRILSIDAKSTYSGHYHQHSAVDTTVTTEGSGSGLDAFGISFNFDKFDSIEASSKPLTLTERRTDQSPVPDYPGNGQTITSTSKHAVQAGFSHTGKKDWTVEVTHAPRTHIYSGTLRYTHKEFPNADIGDLHTSIEDIKTVTFTFDLSGREGKSGGGSQ